MEFFKGPIFYVLYCNTWFLYVRVFLSFNLKHDLKKVTSSYFKFIFT